MSRCKSCAIRYVLCDDRPLTPHHSAGQALNERGFAYARPDYPKEEFADEAEVDEDAEVDAEEDIPEQEVEEEIYSEAIRSKEDEFEESQKEIIVASVRVVPCVVRADFHRALILG